MFAYPLKDRHLHRDVLTAFVRLGLVYEDKGHHNAAFVGKCRDGEAYHAHKRSTNSQGKSFRMAAPSATIRMGWRLSSKTSYMKPR